MELDRIMGVFIGEWEDRRLYAVLYTEDGNEYLVRCEGEMTGWRIVSVKDAHGVETLLAQPQESPSPLSIATDLIAEFLTRDDEDIVI